METAERIEWEDKKETDAKSVQLPRNREEVKNIFKEHSHYGLSKYRSIARALERSENEIRVSQWRSIRLIHLWFLN